MQRVYWIQLYYLTLKLCQYMQANKAKLPSDLKGPSATFFTALDTFCDLLTAYDQTHPRGRGYGEG